MICQKCQEMGEKSIVYEPYGWFTTAMCGNNFYDEEGKYHVHDPNTSTGTYSCSKGHEWSITRRTSCPSCDYGSDK